MPRRIAEMNWAGGEVPPMTGMLVGDGEKGESPWECVVCGESFPGGSLNVVVGDPDGEWKRITLHLSCAEALTRNLRRLIEAIRDAD